MTPYLHPHPPALQPHWDIYTPIPYSSLVVVEPQLYTDSTPMVVPIVTIAGDGWRCQCSELMLGNRTDGGGGTVVGGGVAT